jgi:hypothetical protein
MASLIKRISLILSSTGLFVIVRSLLFSCLFAFVHLMF